MSSRTAFTLTALAFLVLAAAAPWAQDWESFAALSTRAVDPEILRIMAESNLDDNIAICKGLGRRTDADVQVFIHWLADRHMGRTALGTEVLLRWLLSTVLDARNGEQELRAWQDANAPALELLLDRIDQWADPQLKAVLVRHALIANNSQGIRAIMDVGTGLVRKLERSDGLIPSEDAALALDFLAAARRVGRSELFPACVEIARLSRDVVLVSAARAAAKALAAAP
jgi:hypothetical protein